MSGASSAVLSPMVTKARHVIGKPNGEDLISTHEAGKITAIERTFR